MRNRKWKIVFLIMFVCIFEILDLFNIPSRFLKVSGNINYDFQAILWAAVVALVLFYAAYFLIDKHNVEKIKRQYDCAHALMEDIYEECLNNIKIMDNPMHRAKVLSKIDGDKVVKDDNPFRLFEKSPFSSESMFYDFVKDGVLPVKEYRGYRRIKKFYSEYFTMILVLDEDSIELQKLKERAVDELEKQLVPLHNEHFAQVFDK